MDINILVGPVYERQRTQLIDISNPNVNHALCVPMSIHIGRVGLYAGMPSLDMLHYPQADHHQLERLLISKPLSSMYDQWFQSNRYLSYANIPSLSLSMDANDHSQLTSLSPDVKLRQLCAMPRIHHTIHLFAIGPT